MPSVRTPWIRSVSGLGSVLQPGGQGAGFLCAPPLSAGPGDPQGGGGSFRPESCIASTDDHMHSTTITVGLPGRGTSVVQLRKGVCNTRTRSPRGTRDQRFSSTAPRPRWAGRSEAKERGRTRMAGPARESLDSDGLPIRVRKQLAVPAAVPRIKIVSCGDPAVGKVKWGWVPNPRYKQTAFVLLHSCPIESRRHTHRTGARRGAKPLHMAPQCCPVQPESASRLPSPAVDSAYGR